MSETTQSTLDGADAEGTGSSGGGAPTPALVVAWSAEPGRVGQILFLGAGPRLLGRGGPRGDDAHPRLHPMRQRPGALVPMPPLGAPGLSRAQLVVETRPEGVAFSVVGRAAGWLDGVPAEAGVLAPGSNLRLGNQLVLLCVRRSARWRAGAAWPAAATPAFGEPDPFGMVGESPALWRVREACAFAAARAVPVLIHGPTGAGKELAARAVHGLSPRAERPWVARNAATLPVGLIDAELFGNARNYPNPGLAARPGLVGAADGGTLFLDEIGELPEALQTHLLRLLDAGEYHRLGEDQARRAEVRVLAATNRDPAALKFDLRARFKIDIGLPGLAERREDVPLLAAALLRRAAATDPGLAARFLDADGAPRLAPELVAWLLMQPLPHHARGLEALLWRALAESPGDTVGLPSSGSPGARTVAAEVRPAAAGGRAATAAPGVDPASLDADAVRAALADCGGNRSHAWRQLGLSSRYQLLRLLKKFAIADA